MKLAIKLTPDDLRGYVNRQEEWQRFCGADFPDQWQADIDALAKAEARVAELEEQVKKKVWTYEKA